MSKPETYQTLLMEDNYLDGFATRPPLRLKDLINKEEYSKHRKKINTLNRLDQDLGIKNNTNLTRFRHCDGENALGKTGMEREKLDGAGRAQNDKKTLGLWE